jgi:hypothetical protein
MGHEANLYGRILAGDGVGGTRLQHVQRLQERNCAVINSLPLEDEWPWLIRQMFTMPVRWPYGIYRTQVISFGESLKDEPNNRACWDIWLGKFEMLLRRLHWWSAVVHLTTDFEGERTFRWEASEDAIARMFVDDPRPIDQWRRTMTKGGDAGEMNQLADRPRD